TYFNEGRETRFLDGLGGSNPATFRRRCGDDRAGSSVRLAESRPAALIEGFVAEKPRARKTKVKPRKKSTTRIGQFDEARALGASAHSMTHGVVIPLSSGVVVGLGASAGGLTALEHFFSVVPPNSGAGYVIVVHLDPTHVSSVAAILARHAAIPVKEAQDDE